jgi:cell envelope opacity-associated protein A
MLVMSEFVWGQWYLHGWSSGTSLAASPHNINTQKINISVFTTMWHSNIQGPTLPTAHIQTNLRNKFLSQFIFIITMKLLGTHLPSNILHTKIPECHSEGNVVISIFVFYPVQSQLEEKPSWQQEATSTIKTITKMNVIIQDVPFNMHPNSNHILQYKYEIWNRSTSM